ncbi:acyltransferase family protein [Corynebacterium hansenii]|uniref:Acyltransferase family protein n=1 Tax=Corynebacterium hansenii TaxID=394964 RepID=A0ABV7ZKR3_9CORY|nr:acyltransferase family protein [Corynebacterium hansenii]WJY99062.1 O-acetyltransferase OatA [Corynebacterium hansenii]
MCRPRAVATDSPDPDESPARMPKPADSRTTYIPALDGLRTIAVMAVLFYHLGAPWAPGGLLGVAVFFTLSGYLITANLLRAKHRHDSFRLSTFWLRRFRRLVPAVVATVAAVFLVTALSTPGELGERVGESISSLLYVNNWWVIAQGQSYFDQFESTGPLDHMWSLSIEEQFYLVWPLVLALLFALFGRRRKARWLIGGATLALAAASFAWMAHLASAGADSTRVYEGTDTRAGGLLIGALLAILLVRRSGRAVPKRLFREAAGLAGIAVIVVLVAVMPDDSPFLFGGGLAVLSLATMAAILSILDQRTVVSRVLAVAPMRWIGERSYGIYLWHLPVTVYLPRELDDMPLARGAAVIALSFLLAAMSWALVEDPIRRNGVVEPLRAWRAARRRARRDRVPGPGIPRTVFAGATVVLAAVAMMGLPAGVTGGARPGDSLEKDLESLAQSREAAQAAAPAQPDRTMPTGDRITALGDSVLLASSEAMDAEFPGIYVDGAVSRHYGSLPEIIANMEAAGTLDQFVVLGFGTNGAAREGEFEQIVDQLGEDRVIIVVMPYGDRWYMPEAKEQIIKFAREHDNVYGAGWCQAATADPTLLRDDYIHPTPSGAGAYAGAVRDALKQWAEGKDGVLSEC